jgi:hypothetical protein
MTLAIVFYSVIYYEKIRRLGYGNTNANTGTANGSDL